MTREIWGKIINDARWYDGTPQCLVRLTEHFEKYYSVTTRLAMCEANSNAVLCDLTPLKDFVMACRFAENEQIREEAESLLRRYFT